MVFRVFVVLAASVAVFLTAACREESPGKRITVLFPAAADLQAGADVFINGVDVGDVVSLGVVKRQAAVGIVFDWRFAPAITHGVVFQITKASGAARAAVGATLPDIAGRELPEGAVVPATPPAAADDKALSRDLKGFARFGTLAGEMLHGPEAQQLGRALKEYRRWFASQIGMGEENGR